MIETRSNLTTKSAKSKHTKSTKGFVSLCDFHFVAFVVKKKPEKDYYL